MGLKNLYEEELLQLLPYKSLRQVDTQTLQSTLDNNSMKEIFHKVKKYKQEFLVEFPLQAEMTETEKKKHLVIARKKARQRALWEIAQRFLN